MGVREFENLIDRLGEDMSSWHDAERHAGRSLLTLSPEARVLIERASGGQIFNARELSLRLQWNFGPPETDLTCCIAIVPYRLREPELVVSG
jgi:hypothetical protein